MLARPVRDRIPRKRSSGLCVLTRFIPRLRTILGSGGRPSDNQQLLDFLAFAQHRSINLEELWVVETNGIIVWGILPIFSAGRTTLLFTPADPLKGTRFPCCLH